MYPDNAPATANVAMAIPSGMLTLLLDLFSGG
jgi:hypothetical protein